MLKLERPIRLVIAEEKPLADGEDLEDLESGELGVVNDGALRNDEINTEFAFTCEGIGDVASECQWRNVRENEAIPTQNFLALFDRLGIPQIPIPFDAIDRNDEADYLNFNNDLGVNPYCNVDPEFQYTI